MMWMPFAGFWRDNCCCICGRVDVLPLPCNSNHIMYIASRKDIIRAYNLDIERIDEAVIRPMGLDEERAHALREWYVSLIDMMRREGVERSGHLQINRNTLGQLVDLHRRLLSSAKYAEYSAQLYKTLPFIVELRAKGGASPAGELETCFNALYGVLMLRLRGKEISKGTADAVAQISKLLAMLAGYYKLDRDDKLEF